MDATTYLDPAVQRIVADRFVPVRVDSDRRPDLNERYNVGAWPSTVFLTPEGDILCGGTYFDPPACALALERVAEAFLSRRNTSGGRDHRRMGGPSSPVNPRPPSAAISDETESRVEDWLLARLDPVHGGFGTAPKHPHLAAVRLLLERYQDRPDPVLGRRLVHTLDAMIEGGLYDHGDGGFFRYANAEDWTEPQPEKILGDQAAWLELLLEAATTFDREDYKVRAASLADWVLSSLSNPDGGFHGSVWGAGPREIDTTLFVDQNADMAASLVRAADALGDRRLLDAALRSLERVLLITYRPGSGVGHYHDGDVFVRGLLVDQVRASRALIIAANQTGQVPHVMLAEELMSFAARTMWDHGPGGFLDRAAGGDGGERGLLTERFLPLADNCIASRVLLGLAHLAGKAEYGERAVSTLAAVCPGQGDIDFDTAEFASAARDLRLNARP